VSVSSLCVFEATPTPFSGPIPAALWQSGDTCLATISISDTNPSQTIPTPGGNYLCQTLSAPIPLTPNIKYLVGALIPPYIGSIDDSSVGGSNFIVDPRIVFGASGFCIVPVLTCPSNSDHGNFGYIGANILLE